MRPGGVSTRAFPFTAVLGFFPCRTRARLASFFCSAASDSIFSLIRRMSARICCDSSALRRGSVLFSSSVSRSLSFCVRGIPQQTA